MDFVPELTEHFHVEDIFLNGVARIEMVAPNVARLTFYADVTQADGRVEKVIRARLLWALEDWIGTNAVLSGFLTGNGLKKITLPSHAQRH